MSTQKTILLVDDEIDLQELVKMTLKTKGYDVVLAGNGVEALAKLKTMKVDLIILDMNMPKMGGLEFYQNICGSHDRPLYPVLVLTARANMEQLFRQFNIDGFMAKPFEIDELLREVDTILQKYEGIKFKPSGIREPKKVCLIDNNPEELSKIGGALLSAGYIVHPASSGTEGIADIAAIIPDVAVVHLGLEDIAGDLVILKLKMMAKTEGVKCILYTEKTPEKEPQVMQNLGGKASVDAMVEFSAPEELVKAVRQVLKPV